MDGSKELFKQGAEARLYKTNLFGKKVIVKQRFRKAYRQPQLDEKLTQKRTLQEIRAMARCRKAGSRTPLLDFVNYAKHEIYMEEIENSMTLREHVDSLLKENSEKSKSQLIEIALKIGELLAKIHSVDIIHGDLTTSNILVSKDDGSFVMIDFGLSSVSKFAEDMGVDLYVLERAFLSTHPNTEWLFAHILENYSKSFMDKKKNIEVISKLDEVRMRGRKRVMIG